MLIHIVPAVPPAVNGLGDYCYKLWENWPSPRPAWHCIAPSISDESRSHWPEVGLSVTPLSREGLLRALEEVGATTIVLHYVGYGYHPKGCPTWLPQALAEWKVQPDRRLVVMFHELYAKGSIIQTSFWLAPIARKIMIDLAKSADHWVTSCADFKTQIMKEAKQAETRGTVIPIGTNISAHSAINFYKPWPLAMGRKLKIGIFGLPNTRLWAMQAHQNLLKQLCEMGLVESISLVGKPDGIPKTQSIVLHLKEQIGFAFLWRDEFGLTTEALSERLQAQDVGILANWPGTLAKSGIYAALCAHGVVPVAASGHTMNVSESPCLTNDDAWPSSCIEQLSDVESMGELKGRVRQHTEGALNWNTITQHWDAMLSMSSAGVGR